MTAMLTTINLTRLDAVVLGFPLASRALDDFGIASVPEPVKAGFICREVILKVFDRVLIHRSPLKKLYHLFYVLSRYNYLVFLVSGFLFLSFDKKLGRVPSQRVEEVLQDMNEVQERSVRSEETIKAEVPASALG